MNFKELFVDKSNLLIVNTKLAVILGDLNQAIVLNQLNYWLEINKAANKHFIEGKYWVYNSYNEWKNNNFPYWSEKTIQRVFLKLESRGIVLSANFNNKSFDKTKWYTIDFEMLNKIISEYSEPMSRQNVSAMRTECPDDKDEESKPIPENTTREYNTENTVKEHALLSTKVDNRDKYMVSRTKSAQNSGGKPQKKEPTVDPDDFIKSKESVLKDEFHRLYSNNPRNIFTTEQQENDWVDKEYNSLTAIIFEFNHQYKASTGFDAKNLSDESLKRVARNYIKSQESLKDDYDDLQSNKVLIEEYLKTDYGSKHGVIVKSLSHYMSGSIREMLFYKHLY